MKLGERVLIMKKIFSILMLLIIVISYGENNKLEKLNLYSTVKIIKSDDKMGKMLLIVK